MLRTWKADLDGVFAAATLVNSADLEGVFSALPAAHRCLGEVTLPHRREADPFLLVSALPTTHARAHNLSRGRGSEEREGAFRTGAAKTSAATRGFEASACAWENTGICVLVVYLCDCPKIS
jgi:hypothetical protein